jgi:uncharacterized protein (DUF58 family)
MKPGGAFFAAALIALFLGAAAFFVEAVSLIWFLSGLAVLCFILADALLLVFLCDRPLAERDIPQSLAQGKPVTVRLTIGRGGRPVLPGKSLLYDLYPASMDCSAFPARLDRNLLKKHGSLNFAYTLVPRERGPWNFGGLEFLVSSPLRFWRLRVFREQYSRGRTYPDFKRIAAAKEMRGLFDDRGSREIRKRGQGMEWRSLRDYEEGDPVKSIDWRATSRTRQLDGRLKPIVREYQEEQDQQLLFILDTGYRLSPSLFDSALNGVLLLSWAALKHGDAVAALSFGAMERWVPPRKGMSTLTGLMNRLYDLKSAPVPSSPFSALENSLARLHRRTFIILISNFREEDGESLSWILPRISKRHLLLLVNFREHEAETLARRRPATPDETLETAAAFSYLDSRRRLCQSWEHSGLLTLECSGDDISSALVNRYLSVKKSGLL